MASGASRNAPCPCGSGRKLKKCCGASGPAARAPNRLTDEIAAFALRTTDAAELQAAWEEHGETGSVRSDARRFGIFMDWLITGRRRGGRTLLERFEAERGATLSAEERRTLKVHKATRIGVYEVVAARPGTGLRLKDMFSGEEAEVGDVSASRQAVVHDVIAAHVRWTDAPPTLWGEAIAFGPLERAELKFDLEAAYAQAKAREPQLSWHGFLNSAPPLIRRLQAEYRSRRTVSAGVGPTVPLRTAADATRLLAAAALERQERWPDTRSPRLEGGRPGGRASPGRARLTPGSLQRVRAQPSSRSRRGRYSGPGERPGNRVDEAGLGLPSPRN